MNVVLTKKATMSVSKYCAKPEHSCQCWVKTGFFFNFNACSKIALKGQLTCRDHKDLEREAHRAKALWEAAGKFVK